MRIISIFSGAVLSDDDSLTFVPVLLPVIGFARFDFHVKSASVGLVKLVICLTLFGLAGHLLRNGERQGEAAQP